MGSVTTTPARTRACVPGARLGLLVLSTGPGSCVGIDLDSGAFVRGYWADPVEAGLRAYEVGRATIADDDAPPDPAQPEAVQLQRPPEAAGHLSRHRVNHYLKALEAPANQPLLGFLGPAIRYWMVPGTHPSLALVRTSEVLQLVVAPGDDMVRARFAWGGLVHSLPVLDRRVHALVMASGRSRVSGRALADVLGYLPRHLLAALTGPVDGHCYKSVAAVLPPG